jgi:hypothetical protein
MIIGSEPMQLYHQSVGKFKRMASATGPDLQSREEVNVRIILFVLLLLGAHLNLTALVPLQFGATPPPWWVGG